MEVIEVQFKAQRKEFYKNTRALYLRTGNYCVVQADRGEDIGQIISITRAEPNEVEGDMKEILRQVVQYNFVDGVPQPERVDPEACILRDDVLPPPDIELIFVDTYQEQEGERDIITAQVYTDFGAASVHVAIRDDKGNRIESRVGELEIERGYYHCAECNQGLFPPG